MSMTRTPNLHEEDTDEAEDVAAGTDTSSHREGKSAEQRPNNYRSKHSETEQRRRSKINERFQLLREIIPPNDQKRDKASPLLEVIKYIQFLQEKLQVYEGSYEQVWTQEATKLIPWRANNGGVDNFGNQCQAMKNGSMDEENLVHPMTDSHRLLESEFSEEFAYGGADHLAGPTTPAVPFNIPLQSCGYAAGMSILRTENIVSQPEYPVLGMEGRAIESTSSGISNVYSQGLLKKLTQALQTSGVDLSQTNISVQLDIGKRENNGSVVVATAGDVGNRSPTSQLRSHTVNINGKESFHAVKRFKTGES